MILKATLIFDIGKTNKKFFLFDERCNMIESGSVQFAEVLDDDHEPCDDLKAIVDWMRKTIRRIQSQAHFKLSHINFSSYGATLVHLNKSGNVCTPLYNYLKSFPVEAKELFIAKHGELQEWSKETASPFLGMLNAGLQLFWLKYFKQHLFGQIKTTLFLPQYLCYELSKETSIEYTSIGCHTGMWDFGKSDYHRWMYKEGFVNLLPSLVSSGMHFVLQDEHIKIGVGLHDSSAALLPYKAKCNQPFLLLSTGTWSICFNPFTTALLTDHELQSDCVCYLQPSGLPVKASRFLLGYTFTKWEKQIAQFFNKDSNYHKTVRFDLAVYDSVQQPLSNLFVEVSAGEAVYFTEENVRDFAWFNSYEEAYHRLLHELILVQSKKIRLVLNGLQSCPIFVDGGFASNAVFLQILSHQFSDFEVIPSDMPLASSLGAASASLSWLNENETVCS